MKCQACEQHKQTLYRVKSESVPSIELKLCSACRHDQMEPRWAIVLGARSGNTERVESVVDNRRYFGPEIMLKEIL